MANCILSYLLSLDSRDGFWIHLLVNACSTVALYTAPSFQNSLTSPPFLSSPTDFKTTRLSSSIESDRGSLLNALNIVGREEDMVGVGVGALPASDSLLDSSAVITRVVDFN